MNVIPHYFCITMKIEIWSDVMCPFCYIGKRHLESALGQINATIPIEIEWKSFQLDPHIPKQSQTTSVIEYLSTSKGISFEQSREMHERVSEMASKAGLKFEFEHAVVGNSFDAHRLIQLAKSKQCADAMEEALFKAYFTEGKDIASPTDLTAIGLSAGLSEKEIDAVLKSDTFSNAVKKDIEEASQIGVRGVPFFVFDRKYALSGAQPVEAFVQTIEATLTNATSI